MISRIPRSHPLARLFRGLVEQVFMTEIGICDPRLTDYVGDLLGEFLHVDQIYRLRDVDGHTIREVSRMEAESQLGPESGTTERTRVIYRYIGDFTLFWAGLYPESLRVGSGADRLYEYLLQGKRSYGIACELSAEDTQPPAEVLRRLSEEFEGCMHGLHLVREGWQRLETDASGL